jgi:hypothetical protein
MSKKLKMVKVDPATIFNFKYDSVPAKPRPVRPAPTRPAPARRPVSSLREWEYAKCPRCDRRFEILPDCILRKLGEEDSDEAEERGFGFGTFILDPDNECFNCDYSNRVSGWCCIVDTFDDDESSEIRSSELKKYYSKLEKGEDVQLELKLTWSPNPEEIVARAANYEIRKKMVRLRRSEQAMRRAMRD